MIDRLSHANTCTQSERERARKVYSSFTSFFHSLSTRVCVCELQVVVVYFAIAKVEDITVHHDTGQIYTAAFGEEKKISVRSKEALFCLVFFSFAFSFSLLLFIYCRRKC